MRTMRFPLRFARREILVRWQSTATVALAVSIGVATILVTASMSESLERARDEAVAPLLTANVDVVISTLAAETPEAAVPRHDTVNTLTLHPGAEFLLENVRTSDLFPIDATALEGLLREPGISSHAGALVVTVDRLRGIAPPLVTIPERSVAPLTESEEADIQRHLANDETYRRLLLEFDVSASSQDQVTTGEQRDQAELLTSQLREIELSYYPKRFAAYGPESFAITSTEATLTSITVAGLSDIGSSPLLDSASLLEGSFPASGTSQAVVSRSFAAAEGLRVGQTVSVAEAHYAIVGIAEPPIGLLEADVYLSIDAAYALTGVETPNLLVVSTYGAEWVPSMIEAARTEIPSARVSTPDDVSLRLSAILGDSGAALRTSMIIVIAAVTAGALGTVALTVLASIRARGTDIGVLIALGWRKAAITRQVLFEVVLRAGLGAALGVALAWIVDALIARLSDPVTVQVLAESGRASEYVIGLVPTLPPLAAASVAVGTVLLSAIAVVPPLAIILRRSASSLLNSPAD